MIKGKGLYLTRLHQVQIDCVYNLRLCDLFSDIEKTLRYYLHNYYRRINEDLFPQILCDLDFNTRIKRNGGRLRDRAAQSWRLMSLKLTRCEG